MSERERERESARARERERERERERKKERKSECIVRDLSMYAVCAIGRERESGRENERKRKPNSISRHSSRVDFFFLFSLCTSLCEHSEVFTPFLDVFTPFLEHTRQTQPSLSTFMTRIE